MAWTWINDLMVPKERKKDFTWKARCPYHLCPSNQPFRGAHPSRIKFIQKLSIMMYQYKCRDCGCLVNMSVEVPDEQGIKKVDPGLWGGTPSYRFER